MGAAELMLQASAVFTGFPASLRKQSSHLSHRMVSSRVAVKFGAFLGHSCVMQPSFETRHRLASTRKANGMGTEFKFPEDGIREHGLQSSEYMPRAHHLLPKSSEEACRVHPILAKRGTLRTSFKFIFGHAHLRNACFGWRALCLKSRLKLPGSRVVSAMLKLKPLASTAATL